MESYVHRPMGEQVDAIGGRYVLVKEERLPWEGREVLYVVGHAVFDTSCCGVGGCGYAVVQGFVVGWRTGRSEEGLPATELEPVVGDRRQAAMRKAILEREHVQQVNFR